MGPDCPCEKAHDTALLNEHLQDTPTRVRVHLEGKCRCVQSYIRVIVLKQGEQLTKRHGPSRGKDFATRYELLTIDSVRTFWIETTFRLFDR